MNDIKTTTQAPQTVKPAAEENLLYIAIKYKNALIGVVLLLLCLGAGTYFWMQQRQANEQQASLQLSRVAPFLDSGKFSAAINGEGKIPGLKKIAAEYAGTPSGNMAALLLANAWYLSGDYTSALNTFKTVSIANKDLAAAALAGAGACYINRNQFVQAAESYQEASKKAENEVLKAQYLVKSAESLQQTNQIKKAAELYTKIIADYPGSTAAAVAQRSLWQVSGKL
ncbi:tetratricopeptide repeat protein [Chlorobium ferrooxidans]|uniref:TPR repeat n=1 Tax=Chlorobium ferrooxidans DSM 13031 TaxID=377431 RepID=Q0YUU3_9CHLB|nr:tetratricopeptide repeat protein [Chlorobium ferrooxidans]EAT59943.1 TPR repeat [Chlorobium ferrooxidans DSM 13031]